VRLKIERHKHGKVREIGRGDITCAANDATLDWVLCLQVVHHGEDGVPSQGMSTVVPIQSVRFLMYPS
jgi:hypothetical protein